MKTLAISIVCLLCGCSTKIQHGLSERDADEVQAALADRGIAAVPVSEGKEKWAVEVPQASASDAIRILRENNLPRQEAPGFSEVFGQGSMVPTAAEEKAKLIQALSGENARMLEALDGVVQAKVIVVPETKSGAFAPAEPARASVFLKVTSDHATELGARKLELQQLVAGSVPGLIPEHVALLIDPVNVQARPAIVERKDRTAAAAVGIVAGLLIALLAGALVLLTLRTRALRLQLASSAEVDDEPVHSKPAAKRAA
jgi:type III secretion protein J